ncbi:reversion-inducing cysteine-rich protein with Kazal motifs [Tribolium madens]|uniref:reversion-inducing cysteine-rich protein with Kazal motifs n=1 Tax=Tribolium madens TaxID=41895 RepID=UPI001CF73F90|nr:reversion-inducing cysteine-rich protein with Kazal motifs [Tribolium madens]
MSFQTRKSAIFCLIVYFFTWISAQDLMCCSHTTGSCRSVCEKISLAQLAADSRLRNETVEEVRKFCSPQLSPFWECLNATFKDMSRGESWSGRVCCPIPQSNSCRRACITATSTQDLAQGCRQSDEIEFFRCLDRQKSGEECCSNARSDDCHHVCLEIFRSRWTPNPPLRLKVQETCEANSPKVMECVKDFIKVTPAKDLHKKKHCCDMSNQSKCRETCKKLLSMKNITVQESIDGLQLGGCGSPLPQEYFWSCFLKSTETAETAVEVSRIERVGMDSAKSHCCPRAASHSCQKLCTKTFTKFWSTSWDEFYNRCLTQVAEENLRNCIDEVDEPCELGCDGLSFCTNFNNRPTELFRSCNTQADEAARNDVSVWQFQNKLTLPGLILPLKNISQCSPNVWKTVACTLQIKPCSRHSHANQICRDVCLDILSKCVDWTRISPEHSAETICASLSPEDPNVSCIRLQNFLYPSETSIERISQQVFSPCKGNPCEPNEVCLLNRNCIHGTNCLPYKCVPGCKLGEVSEYKVPHGTYVWIPNDNNNNQQSCLKICRCNAGKIEECQPLLCVKLKPCLMGTAMHGTSFNIDCKTCSCFASEDICSKKQCESTALTGENTAYTTLPCNCVPHYVPVCGKDGNNYPSACLAKCAGLTDSEIEPAPCEDPCRSHSCPIGHKCVPRPQICLFSREHRDCKQYECINGTTNCRNLPKSPVCSTNNTEFENSCLLAHHNAKLAYHGPCLRNCRHEGVVCGFNGRTYISECAAWADMVSVDYVGRCRRVGLIGTTKTKRCPDVKCQALPDPNCLGVTPPGACCPICGGTLNLLYSRQQINRALYALDTNTDSLTLKAMLKALDRQIQVAQCVLRGYLTVEMDIFVTVQTTEKYPSKLQLEACVQEAEKIASLVNMQSPRIVSEVTLSSLTLANIIHVNSAASLGASLVFVVVLLKLL